MAGHVLEDDNLSPSSIAGAHPVSACAAPSCSDPQVFCSLHRVGRKSYRQTLDLQLSLVSQCQRGEIAAALVVVEHDPVITKGAGAKNYNLLLSEARLNELGISVVQTDRGGDVTYHGPGQVVAYPILNLRRLGLDVHGYLRKLEDVVIATLSEYGLEGFRHGPAGVWVGDRKVCSIGVAVRRSVTYHGLALNVATDMAHFSYINPCGLAASQVTSISEILGRAVDVGEVTSTLTRSFESVFGVKMSGCEG